MTALQNNEATFQGKEFDDRTELQERTKVRAPMTRMVPSQKMPKLGVLDAPRARRGRHDRFTAPDPASAIVESMTADSGNKITAAVAKLYLTVLPFSPAKAEPLLAAEVVKAYSTLE